jgi:hypothetical protein
MSQKFNRLTLTNSIEPQSTTILTINILHFLQHASKLQHVNPFCFHIQKTLGPFVSTISTSLVFKMAFWGVRKAPIQ